MSENACVLEVLGAHEVCATITKVAHLPRLETISDHRGGERSANIVPLSVAAPPEDTLWSSFLMNKV